MNDHPRELTHEQDAFLSRVEGLFIGILNEAEIAEFDSLVEHHKALYSYEGASGFMGLAKARRLR